MVNRGFGQHGVVFQLGLPQRRAVSSDQHELGYCNHGLSAQGTFSASRSSPPWKEAGEIYGTFAISHLLQSGLVSEKVLSRLYNESETGGNGLGRFGGLGFFGWGHGGGLFCVRGAKIGLFVDRRGWLYSLVAGCRRLLMQFRRHLVLGAVAQRGVCQAGGSSGGFCRGWQKIAEVANERRTSAGSQTPGRSA